MSLNKHKEERKRITKRVREIERRVARMYKRRKKVMYNLFLKEESNDKRGR